MQKFLNTIRNNTVLIRKFVVDQITMSLFGLLVTIPVMVFSDNHSLGDTPIIIASIFSVFVFFFIIHDVFWQVGAKNGLRQKGKGITPDAFVGLKCIFVAYLPTILLTVIAIILYLINIYAGALWAGNISVTLMMIINFLLHGMYLGVYNTVFSGEPYFHLIFLIVTLALPSFSYYLGTKEKKLRSYIGLGNVDFNKKHK